jgi:hypothetical protein
MPAPTGTIDGTIKDSVTKLGIVGAMVTTDTGHSTQTVTGGLFSLTVPITASAGITVTASGYEDGSDSNLNVTENQPTTSNVELVALPVVPVQHMNVDSIDYGTSGGNGTRDLRVTLHVTNTDPLIGGDVNAVMEIELRRDGRIDSRGGPVSIVADGSITFVRKNHKAGNYTTVVILLEAEGREWDGTTIPNSYTKSK